jgi:DNA-binding transcriptional regulator YbjK
VVRAGAGGEAVGPLVPPFNAERRDRLADAAIEILANEGSRGLTHRAVDAQADQPPGTTSRYFRTRDALLRGVVGRIRELHFADLARAPQGRIAGSAIAGHLATMVYDALTANRSRHLAILELFLESTRRPELRDEMVATRTAQIRLMCDVHAAAGIELSTEQAATLVTVITGLVHIALTTPEAIGLRSPEDIRDRVKSLVDTVQTPALSGARH